MIVALQMQGRMDRQVRVMREQILALFSSFPRHYRRADHHIAG